MKLSGEEFLRVSQLKPEHFGTGGVPSIGVITTAPARRGHSVDGDFTLAPGRRDGDEAHARRLAEGVEGSGLDMRDEVVASLRERIEAGTYAVNGEQIAEMMIRRMMADRVR